jgi:outer membrane protein
MQMVLLRIAVSSVLALGVVFTGMNEGQAQAVPPAYIVVVDYLLIQQQSLAMNDLKVQIEQRREVYQERINLQEQELRAVDQELVRQQSILAADAFAQKRREFEAQVAEVQRGVQARKRELDQAFDFGLKEFEREVINIIAELSAAHGYNLVLSRQQIVFANNDLNISQQVLELLNQRLSRVEVPAAPN